jgi:hypothetical protein
MTRVDTAQETRPEEKLERRTRSSKEKGKRGRRGGEGACQGGSESSIIEETPWAGFSVLKSRSLSKEKSGKARKNRTKSDFPLLSSFPHRRNGTS